jgi:hypothetical protein
MNKEKNRNQFSAIYKLILFLLINITYSCQESNLKRNPCDGVKNCQICSNGFIEIPTIYDKNLDSVANAYSQTMIKDNYKDDLKNIINKKVILIHEGKLRNNYNFDCLAFDSLSSNFKASTFDSTDLIIVRNTKFDTIGKYTNGKTIAIKQKYLVKFVNAKTFEIEYATEVAGSNPPTSIKYNKISPTYKSGNLSNKYYIKKIENLLRGIDPKNENAWDLLFGNE